MELSEEEKEIIVERMKEIIEKKENEKRSILFLKDDEEMFFDYLDVRLHKRIITKLTSHEGMRLNLSEVNLIFTEITGVEYKVGSTKEKLAWVVYNKFNEEDTNILAHLSVYGTEF